MCLIYIIYVSSADSVPPVEPVAGKSLKRNTSRTDEASMDNIKSMNAMMAASDWKERHNGILKFREMVDSNSVVVGNHIVKVVTVKS